jgi:nucleotide-binding universal stress UspA family protein
MFKKILVTTDGSDLAEQVLPLTVDLARQCGAELRVLSVVENPVFLGSPEAMGITSSSFYQTVVEGLARAAQDAVERGAARARAADVKATTVVREGNAADEIVAEAAAWGADVIACSTHGRSGVARLLLGSVANSVATHASCPVLLRRAAARKG